MITFEFCGTSHGQGYEGTIYGLPDGFEIDIQKVNEQLRLRKCGYGRSARQAEDDVVVFDGLKDGKTLGGKLSFAVKN
ncbi:MAG: chorismate synthase, partial [Corallococcus sp.]|nr:chorismate synthase [Corallococcus sp.]